MCSHIQKEDELKVQTPHRSSDAGHWKERKVWMAMCLEQRGCLKKGEEEEEEEEEEGGKIVLDCFVTRGGREGGCGYGKEENKKKKK